MSGVDIAFGLVGVLCLANLVLTCMLVRRIRLREARTAAAPRFRAQAGLVPGTKVADFSTVTVEGEPRSLAALAGGRALVAFFSATCTSCRKQLPEFVELARTFPGGKSQVLAVVAGEEAEAARFAAGLTDDASVVFEHWHGPVARAFEVRGFPSFYLVGADGRIVSSGLAVAALAGPVPA
ncbi:MAG: TlpA family protein disulfide reductase [Trebonia sp.]